MPKRPAPPTVPQKTAVAHPKPPTEAATSITPLYASGGEWLAQAATPTQILENLLERADASRLVRTTPAQPLFLFIRALGLADALDVLALCSPQQVQAFLDMDGWDRDHLAPDRIFLWLAALAELGPSKLISVADGLDPELWTALLGPRIRVYDIYKNDEPPDQPEGQFFDTPDRMFRVDILPPSSVASYDDPDDNDDNNSADADPASRDAQADDDASDSMALLQRLLDTMYRGDAELARAIVHSAGYDVGPETSEAAYRFRSGRMADLGYIDYYEALKVYLLLDPQKPPPPSELQPLAAALSASPPAAVHLLPGSDTVSSALLRTMPGLGSDDSTFSRAVGQLSDPEQALLVQHLMVLGNRVLAADRVELGDVDALRPTLRRTVGYLSLGIEYRLRTLAQPEPATATAATENAESAPPPPTTESLPIDIGRAADVLREISLLHLFRIGYGLTVQLRKLALVLVASSDGVLTAAAPVPPAASVAHSAERPSDPARRLPPRLAEPLRALLLLRPLYSPYLDGEPATATRAKRMANKAASENRPFASLRDLGQATALLGELSTLSQLLTTGLGLRREHIGETLSKSTPDEAEVQIFDLVGTLIANLLLLRPPALVPLLRSDLPSLRAAVLPGDRDLAGPDADPNVDRNADRNADAAVAAHVLSSLRERIHSRSFGEAEFKTLWAPKTQRLLHDTLTTLTRSLSSLPADLHPAQADLVPRLSGLLLSR